MFSMIELIDNNTYVRYRNTEGKIVRAKEWGEIRKYYNMLLKYIDNSFRLLWIGKEEHESFAEKIVSDNQEILGDAKTFRDYIENEHLSIYNKSIDIGINVVKHFKDIHANIRVRTAVNTLVEPKIFLNNNIYINSIDKILKILSQGF